MSYTNEVPRKSLSPQAEALMEEVGVTYAPMKIPLERIDIKASLKNQARIEPQVSERIVRYADALSQGAVFPCTLVWDRNGDGSVLINADGNQRTLAHDRAGHRTINAYVFRGAPDQFRVLADMANPRLCGLDNSLEERLMHAAHHADNGVDLTSAASLFGVSKSQLAHYRSAQKQRTRFLELGINNRLYDGLSDYVLSKCTSVADEAILDVLLFIRDRKDRKFRLVDLFKVLIAVTGASDKQRAVAQKEIISDLRKKEEAEKTVTAQRLVRTGEKRDTLYMRLHGAKDSISHAIVEDKPEYRKLLAEIKEMLLNAGI